MRNPRRIPRILAKLQASWEAHPDLRLGQIVSNAALDKDVFFIEDEVLEASIPEVPQRLNKPGDNPCGEIPLEPRGTCKLQGSEET